MASTHDAVNHAESTFALVRGSYYVVTTREKLLGASGVLHVLTPEGW